MHPLLKNNKGYTLLEVLLIIFIIMAVLTVTFMNLSPLIKAKKLERFIDQMENDILYAQNYAISRSSAVKLYFYGDKPEYEIRLGGLENSLLLKRQYDRNISLLLTTLPIPVDFKSNGNIGRGGTMEVSYNGMKYKVVFLLGSGRFYVTKL